ncbi:MAG: hypothetical protein LQ352_000858 [Teloschistes flavicans]|nr:MAG: hypothetical protein LQ352_000858 [Teloschistes flavicans]
MSAGFGFSVGDIVAGLKLIKQSIEALQDTKGSSADFEALGHEIASLKAGLEAVEDLKLDQTFGPESKHCLAIGQAIARCWQCVETFLSTIAKYQPWLRSKAPACLNWKANLKKIQWALCKKDDVNRFRAQLERHTSSIRANPSIHLLLVRSPRVKSPRKFTAGSSICSFIGRTHYWSV